MQTENDDAQNDTEPNSPTEGQRLELACHLRDLANEVERLDRQAASNDLDVHIDDGVATIVIQYEFPTGYDVDADPDDLTEPEVMPDGGTVQIAPDNGDLTRFQLQILYTLAAKHNERDYGLGIKRTLEAYYDDEVNHGRLYPNLDDLVDAGLIDKRERDKRTNEYVLSTEGKELIRRDTQQRHNAVDAIGSGV